MLTDDRSLFRMPAGLPDLEWAVGSGTAALQPDGRLEVSAAPGTDWTNDALGGPAQHAAAMLGFEAPDRFALSARAGVATAPRTTFDAAALAVWGDRDHWAKLCFEYSPHGEAMVVSVVTDVWSDDCNSVVVAAPSVHLRVSRVGDQVWAFHSSTDGRRWDFVRLFRLDWDGPVQVGFLAQAPLGDACVATFDEVGFSPDPPADLRDGS